MDFAEKVTEIFLKNKTNPANPNLVTTNEGLSPLHLACIWGRSKIVRLLLNGGADLDLKCIEGRTPVAYAMAENKYQVIEVIKKFVFEQKMEKKKKNLILKSHSRDIQDSAESTPIINLHLKNVLQHFEENKFTPNRINYNFDVSSPYYVNITHRRKKPNEERKVVKESEDDHEHNEEPCDHKNIFELTEENVKEFSEKMNQVIVIDKLSIHKRRSYIQSWREKIQEIRKSDLNLSYINFLNSLEKAKSNAGSDNDNKSSSDSFATAESKLQRNENAIKQLPELIRIKDEGTKETDDYDTKSRSSISTKATLPPLDYDTDVLRNELTNLAGGRKPGPITNAAMKRLYLKQLVKLRKRPEIIQNHQQRCE